MLVLSRKRGEMIHIGDKITITVVRAHGNHIRIGIDAPPEVRIVRGELDQWSEPAVPDFQRTAPNVDHSPLPR
jgi:carbon storage regulator